MKLILTLLTIIPFITLCQSVDSTKTKKFAVGFTFSPDYCYRSLKPDGALMSTVIADNRDETEIPKMGFTTGLNFTLKVNKRLSFETGLQYSDKGEKTKNNSFAFISPTGQPDPLLPLSGTFIYHYIYLDIPVKVNCYLLTKRMKFYLSAGISPNIFIQQKTTETLEYSDSHTETKTYTENSSFARINLAFVAGFGLSYELSTKLFMKFEPIYRRSINSIIDAPIKTYLYSAGLNMGIYYRF